MERPYLLLACALACAAACPPSAAAPTYEIAYTKAARHYELGEWGLAASLFSESLSARPGDRPATYGLAMSLARRGDYARAASLLRELLVAGEYRDARLQLGVCLAGMGRWAEAREQFRASEEYRAGRAEAWYYTGQCARMLGDGVEAHRAFEEAARRDEGFASLARFYNGLVYLGEGKRREGLAEIEGASAAEPAGTPLRRAAERLTGRRALADRVRFSLFSGYQYDSNVGLIPYDTSIVEMADSGDFRFFVNPRVEILPYESERLRLTALYDFYNSTQNRLGDYNLQGHRLSTTLFNKLGVVWPYVRYDYEYYFLDDCKESFLRTSALTAGTLLFPSERLVTNLWYTYSVDDYFISEFDPNNDRSDHNNAVGIEQYLYTAPRLGRFLRAAFAYDRNDAEGRNFTYNGYRVVGEYLALFRPGLGLDATAELYVQDYDRNVEGREDLRHAYSFRLFKDLTDHFQVAFRYDLVFNGSSVPLYAFRKDVFTLEMACGF